MSHSRVRWISVFFVLASVLSGSCASSSSCMRNTDCFKGAACVAGECVIPQPAAPAEPSDAAVDTSDAD